MQAMVLEGPGLPLVRRELPIPTPARHQVLIAVSACGVCRTDLHLADGELVPPKFPIVPGHEIVGRVSAVGADVTSFTIGERVGVPWLGETCGHCFYCARRNENLCTDAIFTGFSRDGGYAQYACADARFVFRLPARYGDVAAAPLLCAGLIGYRAYAMAGDAEVIGIYGFGAAAHLIAQVACAEGRKVMAFTRPGDAVAQRMALAVGAHWAGGSDQHPPMPIDAALLFAPVGALVPEALSHSRPGAVIVCAGIHMSDIPSFPYRLLWGERVVRSVANLTRADGEAFFALAERIALEVRTDEYPLHEANTALDALRAGRVQGAAVLTTPRE